MTSEAVPNWGRHTPGVHVPPGYTYPRGTRTPGVHNMVFEVYVTSCLNLFFIVKFMLKDIISFCNTLSKFTEALPLSHRY